MSRRSAELCLVRGQPRRDVEKREDEELGLTTRRSVVSRNFENICMTELRDEIWTGELTRREGR